MVIPPGILVTGLSSTKNCNGGELGDGGIMEFVFVNAYPIRVISSLLMR